MKTLKIPKRSGGFRTVVIPSRQHKAHLRALLPDLHARIRVQCDPQIVHGFAQRRSPVTNAMRHVGYQYTLSIDLADFFDSVSIDNQPLKFLSALGLVHKNNNRHNRYRTALVDGVARQGLPTSPLIANLIAADMDRKIRQALPPDCVYTRYADDLTISFNDIGQLATIKDLVRKAAKANKFQINDRKTTFQSARAGFRVITGIAVGPDGIRPTRATRRKLRAARHNANHGRTKHFPRRQWTRHVKTSRHHGVSPMPKAAWLARWLRQKVRGLEEWAALKPPGVGRRTLRRAVEGKTPEDVLAVMAERSTP